MKHALIFILALLAPISAANAQDAGAKPPQAVMQPTAQALAGTIAQQITTQTNGFAQQVKKALTEGFPAQGDTPAIKAEDIRALLGAENVRKLEAALDALESPPQK
jgi:hypothetical protein